MRHRVSLALVCLALALFLVGVSGKSPQWTVREWTLPTPDSRPHDPAAAPDGALWYTAQNVNKLGRVDAKTGAIQEFSVPTAGSGPHGLTADRTGRIWYTGNSKGLIGRLEPRTGQITEYAIQDPHGRDPHTPVFDQKGVLWFTVEDGNAIGRLDPMTSEITVTEVPTQHAEPYGIVVSSSGVPFFCEFGTNQLASIDPKTRHVTEYGFACPRIETASAGSGRRRFVVL